LGKDWQLGDSELVPQEREKSGTKKYPVVGIFGVKEKKVRDKGGFFGGRMKFVDLAHEFDFPVIVFRLVLSAHRRNLIY